MKRSVVMLNLFFGLTALGLAAWWITERQACVALAQENRILRGQLRPTDSLIAQYQGMSNLVRHSNRLVSSSADQSGSLPSTHQDMEEMRRLQAEVDSLHEQAREMERLLEDTRQARARLTANLNNQIAGNTAKTPRSSLPNGSQLEILRAEYWTDNSRMDVTDELRERIQGDSLKAVASNNIRGDPEFGQVKHLTIEYRFAGVAMTNAFREGDLVVLP